MTHWAIRKTLSQASLFYPAPDLCPTRMLKGAEAQLGPGPVPSACLAAFKGSSVPSQFLSGAQCQERQPPMRAQPWQQVWALAGEAELPFPALGCSHQRDREPQAWQAN